MCVGAVDRKKIEREIELYMLFDKIKTEIEGSHDDIRKLNKSKVSL